jgi:hypothetical protein
MALRPRLSKESPLVLHTGAMVFHIMKNLMNIGLDCHFMIYYLIKVKQILSIISAV